MHHAFFQKTGLRILLGLWAVTWLLPDCGFAADEPAREESEPASPLLELRQAWNRRCARDIETTLKELDQWEKRLGDSVPKEPGRPATDAVLAAWEAGPTVRAIYERTTGFLREYNALAYQWRPAEAAETGGQAHAAGVIDTLFMARLPSGTRRWESLRPILLPAASPEAGATAGKEEPWRERHRVREWCKRERQSPEESDFGWSAPEADSEAWRGRAGKWAYDFTLLHLWTLSPPADATGRLRQTWLLAETGAEFAAQWKKSAPLMTVRMFGGDYLYNILPAAPDTKTATREAAVRGILCPKNGSKIADRLAAIQNKDALLETMATVLKNAGEGSAAQCWMEAGAHANPPWTPFLPEISKNRKDERETVRAVLDKPGQKPEFLPWQLTHQIEEIGPDYSWTPSAQSWSSWTPVAAAKTPGRATVPEAKESAQPEAAPGHIEAAWAQVCSWAAEELRRLPAGQSYHFAGFQSRQWWFAFPQHVLEKRLAEEGIRLAPNAQRLALRVDRVDPGKSVEVSLVAADQLVAARRFDLPGPWPVWFAAPKPGWMLRGTTGALAAALLAAVWLRKRSPRHRVEGLAEFLLYPRTAEPAAQACLLGMFAAAAALTLWWMGPATVPNRICATVEIEAPAHRAVTEAHRKLFENTAREVFSLLSGDRSAACESWGSAFVKALRCAVFLERPGRQSPAGEGAVWRLRPSGYGTTQQPVSGLLRAENKADFNAALARWKYDAEDPQWPLAIQSGPAAPATLVLTDGDHGRLAPPSTARSRAAASERVVSLFLPTPPRDRRPAVATGVAERLKAVAAASTLCLTPCGGLPGATPVGADIRFPETEKTGPQPADLDAARAAWWRAVPEETLARLAQETAGRFAQCVLLQGTDSGGSASLHMPREPLLPWGFALAGAVLPGLLVLRASRHFRELLERWLPARRDAAKRRGATVLGCVLAWLGTVVAASALAASLERYCVGYGLPVTALGLVSGVALGLALLAAAAAGAGMKRQQAVVQARFAPMRFAAFCTGLLLLALAAGWMAVLPGSAAIAPGTYRWAFTPSAAVGIAAWVLGVMCLTFASSTVTKPNRRRS